MDTPKRSRRHTLMNQSDTNNGACDSVVHAEKLATKCVSVVILSRRTTTIGRSCKNINIQRSPVSLRGTSLLLGLWKGSIRISLSHHSRPHRQLNPCMCPTASRIESAKDTRGPSRYSGATTDSGAWLTCVRGTSGVTGGR